MSADPMSLLDELDEARGAIGDSPAFRVVGFVQDEDEVLAEFDDGGASVFAQCYGIDAAELVAAAVNAAPKLTAALRAVLAKHISVVYDRWGNGTSDPAQVVNGFCRQCGRFDGATCPTVTAITTALGGAA